MSPATGPRLDHGGALPVLAPALVVDERRLDRDRERRRARIGPQAQIGAEDVAVARCGPAGCAPAAASGATKSSVASRRIGDGRRLAGRRRRSRSMSEEKLSSRAPSLPMPSTIQPEPSPGRAGSGSFSLPWPCGVAQQEVDGGARCRRRRDRSARRTVVSRLGLAGQVGQRDQDMRLALQAPQRRHQRRFRTRLRRARQSRDLATGWRRAARATVSSNSASQDLGPAAHAVAQEGREVEDGGEEVALLRPCADSSAASRGSSASRRRRAISASCFARLHRGRAATA